MQKRSVLRPFWCYMRVRLCFHSETLRESICVILSVNRFLVPCSVFTLRSVWRISPLPIAPTCLNCPSPNILHTFSECPRATWHASGCCIKTTDNRAASKSYPRNGSGKVRQFILWKARGAILMDICGGSFRKRPDSGTGSTTGDSAFICWRSCLNKNSYSFIGLILICISISHGRKFEHLWK